MSEMRNPKYQEKIVSKIKSIENTFEGLTVNEMSAIVCAAITDTLIVKKGYSVLKIKQFYATMAANAIDKTEMGVMIYNMRFKDDKN